MVVDYVYFYVFGFDDFFFGKVKFVNVFFDGECWGDFFKFFKKFRVGYVVCMENKFWLDFYEVFK